MKPENRKPQKARGSVVVADPPLDEPADPVTLVERDLLRVARHVGHALVRFEPAGGGHGGDDTGGDDDAGGKTEEDERLVEAQRFCGQRCTLISNQPRVAVAFE